MDKINVLKIREDQIDRFLEAPESGMGYQTAMIKNGFYRDKEELIITNAEYAFDFKNHDNIPFIADFNNFINKYREGEYLNFHSLGIITNSRYQYSGSRKPTDTSTYPPFTYFSRPGDEFIRLSAFKNDRRIKNDGSVVAGTYATTVTDLTITPSGLSAVGRFALPNRLPACFKFNIIPPVNTPIFFGTVTPNFGMSGGGVEVFFPDSLPKSSAQLVGVIPEM